MLSVHIQETLAVLELSLLDSSGAFVAVFTR